MFGRWLLISIVILSLFGCAGLNKQIDYSGIKNTNPELMKRFGEYWHYRLKKDINKAKKYEAPHIQYIVNDEDYRTYFNIYHKKSKIGKIIAYDLACEKKFYCSINYKFYNKNGKFLSEGKDFWVKVAGKWYHNIYNPILFPFVK